MKEQDEPKKPTVVEQKTDAKPVNEVRKVEISPEAKEDRLLLTGLLLHETEKLAEEAARRKRKREEEKFELHSGRLISISEIKNFVTSQRQPYSPKFPNSIPFFREIYRLNNWTGKDPNKFVKPQVVGLWIKELIYQRFNQDVLPALAVFAMPGGIRLHKFFQFLTEEGQSMLVQFRDEAIEVMKTCDTWYDFRVKYAKKYGLPVQLKLIK